MPQVIESLNEFATRQGCPYLDLNRGQANLRNNGEQDFVFANGARSNGERHTEPPTDPLELAHLKLKYHEAKLAHEVKAFTDYKLNVQQQLDHASQYPNLPIPGEEAVQQLQAGAKRIEQLTATINELRQELDDLTGRKEIMQRKETEAKARRNHCDQMMQRVQDVALPTLPSNNQ